MCNNSSNVNLAISPCKLAKIISCILNSAKTCLQAPHGGVNALLSATIQIFLRLISPSETALKIELLSAQLVKPYEAFSTLHPV